MYPLTVQKVTVIPDGTPPPPDPYQPYATREMLRQRVLAAGGRCPLQATRDQLLELCDSLGLPVTPEPPAARPFQAAKPTASPQVVRKLRRSALANYTAKQLRALCHDADPSWRPHLRSGRATYLNWLRERGLVDDDVADGGQ